MSPAKPVVSTDKFSRGKRVQAVQEALGLNGKGFVALLQQTTEALGLSTPWHDKRLSTIINGGQDLSPEDIAIISAIDPNRRTWQWLAFGVELPAIKRPKPGEGGAPPAFPLTRPQRPIIPQRRRGT